jgi:NADPH:quinone reductase-like Zn-dependent oxidoreductase
MLALLATDGAPPLVRIGDAPEPSAAGEEAVVEVEAFSINRGETFLLEQPRPGWRPGKDIAGRVVQAAACGDGPAVGTHVVGHPAGGGWAQRVAVPVDALAPLPAEVESVTAAALPLAGLTALRLIRAAGARAGQRMLLTGASGGVGHFVTELASAVGAEITAVTASPDRARRLLELGATAAVRSIDEAPDRFDIVLESVGGKSLPSALARLKRNGLLIWFGQASRERVELDFFAYFDQTGATIRHFHYEDSDQTIAADLERLVRLVASNRLHPELGLVANWTQTASALEALRTRQLRGNAVLCIPPS